ADSLNKTGFFDAAAVSHWRQAFRTMRRGSPQRSSVEMGLVGVISTQLWYHTFIDDSLADLPSVVQSQWSVSGDEERQRAGAARELVAHGAERQRTAQAPRTTERGV